MTLLQKIKNWWNAENRANPLNPRNWWAILQAKWRKTHKTTTPKHILEQAAWREGMAETICMQNNSCRSCGCTMKDEKLLADMGCHMGCYPNMMNANDWNQFKLYIKKHNIK